jgi:hypothetical protein
LESCNLSLFRKHQDWKQDPNDPILPSHKVFVHILGTFLGQLELFHQAKTLILACEYSSLQSELGMNRLLQMILALLQGITKVEEGSQGSSAERMRVNWTDCLDKCLQDALLYSVKHHIEDMDFFVYRVWSMFLDYFSSS